MAGIDPNILFKLNTIRKQMATGRRPGRTIGGSGMRQPRQPRQFGQRQPRQPSSTAQGAMPFSSIPDFQNYNTSQMVPQDPSNQISNQPMGYAEGGEVTPKKPNFRTHPFQRRLNNTEDGSMVAALRIGGMAHQGNTKQLPKSQYGTDTIPAALTPGEMVLTPEQQSAVAPIPGKQHKLRPDQLAKFHSIHGLTPPMTHFDDGGVVKSLEDQYQDPSLSYEERRDIYNKILKAKGVPPDSIQPPNNTTPTPTPTPFKYGGVTRRMFKGGAGDIEITGNDPFGGIPHGFGPASNTSPKAQGPPDKDWSPPEDLNQGDTGRGAREGWRDNGWDSWSGPPTLSGLYGQPQSFGTSPDVNYGAFGDTKLPTWWVNYPDVGNVPMAIPYGPATGSDNYGSGEKDD